MPPDALDVTDNAVVEAGAGCGMGKGSAQVLAEASADRLVDHAREAVSGPWATVPARRPAVAAARNVSSGRHFH